jgi:hypothetical protein
MGGTDGGRCGTRTASCGQCQSVTEAGLAARLEKVSVRLAADAPGVEYRVLD